MTRPAPKLQPVRLRLCDEDRERFGGDEWIRFDPATLDDQPFTVLHEWEASLNVTIEFLIRVDWPTRMARGTAAKVWLARKIAGVPTPDFEKFDIKVRKVIEEPDGADADPPGLPESSAADQSATDSH